MHRGLLRRLNPSASPTEPHRSDTTPSADYRSVGRACPTENARSILSVRTRTGSRDQVGWRSPRLAPYHRVAFFQSPGRVHMRPGSHPPTCSCGVVGANERTIPRSHHISDACRWLLLAPQLCDTPLSRGPHEHRRARRQHRPVHWSIDQVAAELVDTTDASRPPPIARAYRNPRASKRLIEFAPTLLDLQRRDRPR